MEGEFSAEFRVQAGRVLARRNREVLAEAGVAQMVPGARKRLRRVGQRQGIQIALLMKGPAPSSAKATDGGLRSFSEEGGAR